MEIKRIKANTWVIEANQLIPFYKLDSGRCVLLDTGLPRPRSSRSQSMPHWGPSPRWRPYQPPISS